jgi:dihydropteroate synthase type 2
VTVPGIHTKIVGVVNITTDSFSDGGLYFKEEDALAHARELRADGADIIELGAASSHPDALAVTPQEEMARLAPVLRALSKEGVALAIDSTQPEVQRFAVAEGVRVINDVRGFRDPVNHGFFATEQCSLVVMHSIAGGPTANRTATDPETVYRAMCEFFEQRVDTLRKAGLSNDQLIIDPGMGFFLGSNPETSLAILTRLSTLRSKFGLPLFISVSRKSFLKNLLPTSAPDIATRTLAAELFAALQGADYIRTHAVRPLREALAVLGALAQATPLTQS